MDLADVLPVQALKRAIDEADHRRLLDHTALVAAVRASPGRRGARVLGLAGTTPELTRSDLAQRLLALIEAADLPRPRVAARVAGFEVDFLWPGERLIVETDGLAAHATRAALERDRLRDRCLLLGGYRVVRLTARALEHEPNLIASDLAKLLVGPARPSEAL
jgi:very-short-patch-repair endonuclease